MIIHPYKSCAISTHEQTLSKWDLSSQEPEKLESVELQYPPVFVDR